MTHNELVQRAIRWLRNTHRCPVVIAEMSSGGWEEPDAIGFRVGWSALIECKTSLADMRKDAEKPHRRNPERGMGDWRYIMAEKPLAEKIQQCGLLPEGWGLLSVSGTRCDMPVRSKLHKHDKTTEVALMGSAMQRLSGPETKGVSVRLYVRDNANPRAEIHVETEAAC